MCVMDQGVHPSRTYAMAVAQPAATAVTPETPTPTPTVATAPNPRPQAPKCPRPKRKTRIDARLLVRIPKVPIPEDPVYLASFRGYLPKSAARLVQRISRTKTGVALWPFWGAKAECALIQHTEAIEEALREHFVDVTVARTERWHTRVIDQLPNITLRQAKAELWASTGQRPVRAAVRDAKDGTFRAVAHFADPPPRFMLFGRWARPVGQKSTRSDPRQRERAAK